MIDTHIPQHSARGLASRASKRRRTAAQAASTAADAAAPSTPDAAAQRAAASTAVSAESATLPPASAAAGQAAPMLRSGLGQVIATASTFMRVEVHTLLPDDEPTPPGWRPPHLRDGDHADGGGAEGPAAAAAEGGSDGGGTPPPATAKPLPVLLCSVRSLLRKLRQDVVVGDVVRVGSIDWAQGRGVVQEVLPRSSRLQDPSVANVDHVLLVFALDRPPFEEQQVSRFLVAAEAAGLPFSLILNKADLVPPEVLQRRLVQCRSWGYEPIVLSCETGEGVEQVASVLQGRISVVAGPSGAGKSSLINCLRVGRHRPDLPADPRVSDSDMELDAALDSDLADSSCTSGSGSDAEESGDEGNGQRSGSVRGRKTGEAPSQQGISSGRDAARNRRYSGAASNGSGGGACGEGATGDPRVGGDGGEAAEFLTVGALSKMGRGMHTTTTVRLLRLRGGGWLADTPGFGQPTLDDISSPQLSACFPEIAARVAEQPCRFADCLHVAEPGCSVSGAELGRYVYYLRFLQEIKTREASDVVRLQRAKAEREGFAKAKSVRGGGERLEARLDVKKHRRTSRQSTKQAGRRAVDGIDD